MIVKTQTRWASLVLSVLIPLAVFAGGASNPDDPDPTFDRFDGTGASGKTVNVVEWKEDDGVEQLEIHVYPAGSLASLALKLEKNGKGDKVMVIGYHFAENPDKEEVRRAIVSIPMNEGFKAWRDTTAKDYDKIVIRNQPPKGKEFLAYSFKAPKQMYPDGHPALAQPNKVADTNNQDASRKPASGAAKVGTYDDKSKKGLDEDSGSIRGFGN